MIRDWFKQEYKIVEVEKPRTYSPLDETELRDSLHSLNAHPGFRYLIERLRSQRFSLEGRLKGARHKTLDDVGFLQQGVFWLGWIESEVARLSQAPQRPQLDPVEQELIAFRELDSLLERVTIERSQTE